MKSYLNNYFSKLNAILVGISKKYQYILLHDMSDNITFKEKTAFNSKQNCLNIMSNFYIY